MFLGYPVKVKDHTGQGQRSHWAKSLKLLNFTDFLSRPWVSKFCINIYDGYPQCSLLVNITVLILPYRGRIKNVCPEIISHSVRVVCSGSLYVD